MSTFRFHLQKYKPGSKITCPACGKKKCFTKYIDEEGIINFPDTVGKCDHECSCGYHYTPKAFFQDNPEQKSAFKDDAGLAIPSRIPKIEPPKPPSFIPTELMQKSLSNYFINPLYTYLSKIMGEEETRRLFLLYHVGTSKKWKGSTVFWQTDIHGKVHTGKVMLYDANTGHRVKEPKSYISWAHSELKLPDFHLKQCLFGEHLLPTSNAKVLLVESEKTVLIGAHFMPQFIWLATGGMNGCFNSDATSVLKGRDVMLLPDLGATEKWEAKLPMLKNICHSVSISNTLEKTATDEQRKSGFDVADFLLMEETKEAILQRMIEQNPAVGLLVEKLGLEIVDDE